MENVHVIGFKFLDKQLLKSLKNNDNLAARNRIILTQGFVGLFW